MGGSSGTWLPSLVMDQWEVSGEGSCEPADVQFSGCLDLLTLWKEGPTYMRNESELGASSLSLKHE